MEHANPVSCTIAEEISPEVEYGDAAEGEQMTTCPDSFASVRLGRRVLTPKGVRLTQALIVINLVMSWTPQYLDGAWAASERKGGHPALTVVPILLYGLVIVPTVAQLTALVGGAVQGDTLEHLGMGTTRKVSTKQLRDIHRSWNIIVALWVVPMAMLFALGTLNMMLSPNGSVSKLTGVTFSLLYKFRMIFFNSGYGIFFMVVIPVFVHTLKIVSVLAGSAIADVIAATERTQPSSPEWQTTVVDSALLLATETLPVLSRHFGPALGVLFFYCWVTAFSLLLTFLQFSGIIWLITMIMLILLPFALSLDVARASSLCDMLREVLNLKRIAAPFASVHQTLKIIEQALDRLNQGQGLGFVVFGTVLDMRKLSRIFAAVISILSAVLPIVFALAGTDNTSSNLAATDAACSLTSEQKTLLQSAVATFNASCAWSNATIAALVL